MRRYGLYLTLGERQDFAVRRPWRAAPRTADSRSRLHDEQRTVAALQDAQVYEQRLRFARQYAQPLEWVDRVEAAALAGQRK
jgi:hypothetical protein